jgi:hypothetical protein
MSIKQIITGLALSLLLASGVASADWDDVYYCQMTNFVTITSDGGKRNRMLEKFQFKIDRAKTSIVFGKSSYLANLVIPLTEGEYWPSEDYWNARDTVTMLSLHEGQLLYSSVAFNVTAISADCDKF